MGDIGKLDKNRNLYITGRVKDIIILRNAKKINASQIETIVSQCFEVMGEVCVKAKPNDSNYDDIHAFIYTRLVLPVLDFLSTALMGFARKLGWNPAAGSS